MTFVVPSNCKLVDRAVRYVQYLFHQRLHRLQQQPPYIAEQTAAASRPVQEPGEQVPYDEVALTLKEVAEQIGPTDSIVIKTYETLLLRLESKPVKQ